MTREQLVPSAYLFLRCIYIHYNDIKAEDHKNHNIQLCIDRLEAIGSSDITEHARLLVIDRKMFQGLLPHMGHPDFFRLNKMITDVIDAARKLSIEITTKK